MHAGVMPSQPDKSQPLTMRRRIRMSGLGAAGISGETVGAASIRVLPFVGGARIGGMARLIESLGSLGRISPGPLFSRFGIA